MLSLLIQTSAQVSQSASLLSGERVASGAIGAIVALVIREIWVGLKSRRASKVRLRTLLTVARDEVAFYLSKLEQLERELGKFVAFMQSGGTQSYTPSYTLYPEFLEHQRRLIAEHGLSPSEVVKRLGHCAFELRHIAKRIADARTTGSQGLAVADWSGTRGLVSANVKEFKQVERELELELGKLN